MKDVNHLHKKYTSSIDKCLEMFEGVSEWADISSFLGKLIKVINFGIEEKEIPRKIEIGKRLSQCLNPGLPSRVQEKALEAYELLFKKLGNKIIKEDFHLYGYGLLEFSKNIPNNIRVKYLNFLKKQIPLFKDDLECSRSIQIAFLSALDDDGKELANYRLKVLSEIREIMGHDNFYERLWECLLLVPKLRVSITAFLCNLPPKKEYLQSLKKEALILESITACLNDNLTLTIRNILDFLINNLSINRVIQAKGRLKQKFLYAVLCVFLKKDTSLNRRSIEWISGEKNPEKKEIVTLSEEAIEIIADAMIEVIKTYFKTSLKDLQKPLKVIISLMDKPEIGSPLCKKIFPDLLKETYNCFEKGKEEIIDIVNAVFEVADLSRVWGAIYEIMISDIDNKYKVGLIKFAVMNLKICESEAFYIHLPLFIYLIPVFFSISDKGDEKVITLIFELCIILQKKITFNFTEKENYRKLLLCSTNLRKKIHNYYINNENLDVKNLNELKVQIIYRTVCDIRKIIQSHKLKGSNIYSLICKTLEYWLIVHSKIFSCDDVNDLWLSFIDIFYKSHLNESSNYNKRAILKLITMIASTYPKSFRQKYHESLIFFLEKMWDLISNRNYEIIECIVEQMLKFSELISTNALDEFIVKSLASSDRLDETKIFKIFFIFWEVLNMHFYKRKIVIIKSLHYIIGAASGSKVVKSRLATVWLNNAVRKEKYISRIFESFIESLSSPEFFEVSELSYSFDKSNNYSCNFKAYKLKYLSFEYIEWIFKHLLVVLNAWFDSISLKQSLNNISGKNCTSSSITFHQDKRSQIELFWHLYKIIEHYTFTELNLLEEPLSTQESEYVDAIQSLGLTILKKLFHQEFFIENIDYVDRLITLLLEKLFFCVTTSKEELQTNILEILLEVLCMERSNFMVNFCSQQGPFKDLYKFTNGTSQMRYKPLQLLVYRGLSAENSRLWNEFISLYLKKHSFTQGRYILVSIVYGQVCDLLSKYSNNIIFSMDIEQKLHIIQSLFRLLEEFPEIKEEESNFAKQWVWSGFLGNMLWIPRESITQENVSLTSETYQLIRKSSYNILEMHINSNQWETDQYVFSIVNSLYISYPKLIISIIFELWCFIKQPPTVLFDVDLNLDEYRPVIRLINLLFAAPSLKIAYKLLCGLYKEICPIINKSLTTQNQHGNSGKYEINLPYNFCDSTNEFSLISLLEWFSYLSIEREDSSEKLVNIWESFNFFQKDIVSTQYKRKAIILGLLNWSGTIMVLLNRYKTNRSSNSTISNLIKESKEIFQKYLESALTLCLRYLDIKNSKPNGFFINYTDHLIKYLHQIILIIPKEIDDPEFVIQIGDNIFHLLIHPMVKLILSGEVYSFRISPLELIESASLSIPGLFRLWKREIFDYYMDHNFFSFAKYRSNSTKSIIAKLFYSEPTRLDEVIKLLSSSGSGSLFSHKENEILSKFFLIKKISYALYVSNTDLFIPLLPNLHEKISELFKISGNLTNSLRSMMYQYLFLLLRTMIWHFDLKNLSNLWPIIHSEAYNFLSSVDTENSNTLDAIFYILKFYEACLYLKPVEYIMADPFLFKNNLKSTVKITETEFFKPFGKVIHQLIKLNFDINEVKKISNSIGPILTSKYYNHSEVYLFFKFRPSLTSISEDMKKLLDPVYAAEFL